MTIAVQLSAPETTNDTGAVFNLRCFTKLAKLHPAIRFIFIFDQEPKSGFEPLPNISVILSGPVVKNNLIQHYWYHFKLSRLLNRQNATLFISSTFTCSLKTNIPQTIWLNDATLFSTNGNRQTKKWLSRYIAKADTIITINQDIHAAVEKSIQRHQIKQLPYHSLLQKILCRWVISRKKPLRTNMQVDRNIFCLTELMLPAIKPSLY